MNIKVIGQAMVITSAHTVEDLRLIERVAPKELCLYSDEAKANPTFAIALRDRPNQCGSFDNNGIIYDSADSEGNAQLTVKLPPVTADKREEFLKEYFSGAIIKLLALENNLSETAEVIRADQATAMANVSID